jgi:hypothetical protein|nr:MAG TPA: tail collar fiber protein [Caudoviricetes sp.]
MSAKFYTLMTDIGAAKLASAAALGIPLKITQMAVGDGGGVLPTPDAKQTALVAEKRRAALNMLYIDPQNSSQIIAEQVIPETEGGWWIREVGLFDETGALIAVGNCPESYKPQLVEGSGRTQTVRMVLITSSTDNITLKIDPSVVLATRSYVDNLIETRQQKSDTLTALAELKPAKGKFPYFTAEKAAALADLSDFIRPMLGKGDAATVLDYLGLKGAAKREVGGGENQIPDMSLFEMSQSGTMESNSGYAKLPNGLIFQWVNTTSHDLSGTVTLPITFPNSVLMAMISDSGGSSAITSTSLAWVHETTTKSTIGWVATSSPGFFCIFTIGF